MYYSFPKINFIGNKQNLAKIICDNIPQDATTLFDAFSGGGSVSFEAKKKGLQIISNDIMKINYLIAKALVENNSNILDEKDIKTIFSGKPKKGFMYKNYSEKLFYPSECMELDQYRANIERLQDSYKKALAFILLRRAMIRKMPYSRLNLSWAKIVQLRNEKYSYEKYGRKRAYHNKTIKEHVLENLNSYNKAVFNNGQENKALNLNVFNAINKIKADIIYLDPPYTGTMNNYFEFYNPLDEFAISKNLKPFKDNFVDRRKSLVLFEKLFSKLGKYKYWILSYNNKSYPTEKELINILKKYSGKIKVIEVYHAYKLTGKENKRRNKEFLFIVENGAKAASLSYEKIHYDTQPIQESFLY